MNHTAPWSNSGNAPSELHKRPDGTKNVLDSMGVKCDSDHVQAFIENDWMGDIIIQSSFGGWSKGNWRYHPEMEMSYWNDIDHVIWSKANDDILASGRVMRIKCEGETIHLAHWPICNNISRIYPKESPLPFIPKIDVPPWLKEEFPPNFGIFIPPVIEPEIVEPTPVSEPGTLALFLRGSLVFMVVTKGMHTMSKKNK